MLTERRKCAATAFGEEAANGRFRVFREGWIKTDHGMSLMTPKAGAEVIKKFRERGNDMMIDLRHFSVSASATREQSEAMGWIPCPNGLQYVDGDGLYAVGVQWVPEVKEGLECKPPKWKYFSPLYDQDRKSKTILELQNVALTNMPATHGLNRLAAERGKRMDLVSCGKALIAAMTLAESGDANAVAVRDNLIAALGDQADAAIDAAQKAMAGVEETAAGDDMYAGMADEEKAMVASMPDEMKATYMAGKKAMSADADKTVSAESEKKDEVAAESDGDKDKVSAGFDAKSLLLMARGAEAQTKGTRERIVAEHAHLIPPAMKAIVMDPAKVSDKTLAEFIETRKAETKTVTVTAGRTTLPAKPPQTRTSQSDKVPDTIAAESARIARKTGTDPKKILGEVVAAQKAAAREQG